MNDRPARQGQATRGKRHPLLLQQQLSEQTFWPCILILAVSLALLIWNPAEFAPHRPGLILLVVGSGLILIFTFILRLTSYVQCQQRGLRIRLPFHRLIIPYRAMLKIRPTELYRMFPPREQRWTQRRFLKRLFGRTVVVIEVEELPRHRAFLRLWMSKYMLCPDGVGWVLAVQDWIAFRTELDEFRTRFK